MEADAVTDALETHAPGALLLAVGGAEPEVLARGVPADVKAHPRAAEARTVALTERVVLPALVNAHAHLDLTHIGPRPFDRSAGFVPWVNIIRRERASEDAAIVRSVRRGIEMSRMGGVAIVGDISGVGSLVPARELANSSLRGVSFIEFFGVGRSQDRTIEAMRRATDEDLGNPRVRLGLQPHAPYSAALGVYRAAVALAAGMPIATHLGETPEEVAFVRYAAGPLRELLERIGEWDDTILHEIGHHDTPIAYLAPVLGAGSVVAAHVNHATDADLHILQRSGTTVAYCPRCSAYFGRELDFGPHRYREMIERGINVTLGTDSIVNLPAGTARLSVLDEMALLHARDRTDVRTLLAMATVNGARALGIDEGLCSFQTGPVAGVIAIPGRTMTEAIQRAGQVEWIA
ncbi:MAG: amidohydrolase family protein [Phycisphaerales bacterium]